MSVTERQKTFLNNRGIISPPTKGGANTTIHYIKFGNFTGPDGQTESDRIALTINTQKEWVGQRVMSTLYSKRYGLGTVQWIKAKWCSRVFDQKDSASAKFPHPFEAMVDFEKRGKCVVSIGTLIKITENV